MTVRILDVSSYQGQVDWAAVVGSGRAGGICKATEGLGYVDRTFARNWQILGGMNATRGAYCFAQPDRAAPEPTAQRFLSVVGPVKPTDILVLDLEVGNGDLSAWALRWLALVKARTGITPWLYSYAPFIRAHLTDPALAAYPLWLAAYQRPPPVCPAPWHSYILWQHTDSAAVPGIAGKVDESVGDLPASVVVPVVAASVVAVPGPVHDFEENSVKLTMMHIGPLDKDGHGWADWQPGLGRDPNPVALVLQGPSPPDDNGYWPDQEHVQLSAQPRGGALRVVVRGGVAGDTVTCWATVS